MADRQDQEDRQSIEAWLVTYLAKMLRVPPETIGVRAPFHFLGVDSRQAVACAADLENWLGIRLPSTLAWDFPTIESLAKHLASSDYLHSVSSEQPPAETRPVPVAVIGMGCRFPGANGPDAFWKLLRNGVDAITEVPNDRWDVNAFYDPNPSKPGKMTTRWGGFIDRIDAFDANFFGISPREASRMDPQQRLMLEVAWEALEDAGQPLDRLAGTATGVFIGIATGDYGRLQMQDSAQIDAYVGTGSSVGIVANRISYFFDLRGPSLALDTSCASSLVAVHLACQSLWNGESSLALAGGVNAILSPALAINFSKAGAMATDGRCKPFDAKANGYVRAEGAGVVVLKPLDKALADHDPIHAVILGSAINQDGRTNGLMAPNRYSQEAVLRHAYSRAGISPRDVQYVEAHGTGTLLGDPIEAAALGAVVGKGRPPTNSCVIGSVKSNIGHLEAAAGIAGLIKTILSIQHRQIPPTVHFQQANPHIAFDSLGLKVQQALGPWTSGGPALAGVSSFGFGGTNAHVVLREAPVQSAGAAGQNDEDLLFPLSARSEGALRELAERYRDFFNSESEVPPRDVSYTLALRRTHHDHRFAFTARSKESARDCLNSFLSNTGAMAAGNGKLVFVFSGQGSQWTGMARELLQHEPVFRATIERCNDAIRPFADWSITDLLAKGSELEETHVLQPVLFAIQVALAELWRSWGIQPDAVVGHSMGELAAAHFAGILSLRDALRIVCLRSRLINRVKGGMALVELSLDRAERIVADYQNRLSVAASNSPTSTVLSGDPRALEQVLNLLQREQIFCRLIKADVAAHSPQLEPMREEMLQGIQGIQPQKETIPFFSTVRAGGIDAFDEMYWWENMRRTVQFSEAMDRLIESGHRVFLEVSPHPILLNAISDSLRMHQTEGNALSSLRRGAGERATLMESAGTLYGLGRMLRWSALYPNPGRCVPLPSYPWQHERFWFEPPENKEESVDGHPLLGCRVPLARASTDHFWQCHLSLRRIPFVRDHCVQQVPILPGAAYVEMAVAAATELFGTGAWDLTNVQFHKALFFSGETARTVQTILSEKGTNEAFVGIYSRQGSDGDWILHASCQIERLPEGTTPTTQAETPSQSVPPDLRGEAFYCELAARGNDYGPCHQGVRSVWRGNGDVLVEVHTPSPIAGAIASYHVHPSVLDSLWHAIAAARLYSADSARSPSVPVHIDRLKIFSCPGPRVWSHARLATGDVVAFDETGAVLIETRGLRVQALDEVQPASATNYREWLYAMKWRVKARMPSSRRTAQGPWIILRDHAGIGELVAQMVRDRGDACIVVDPGNLGRFDPPSECCAVLHLGSLDASIEQAPANLMSVISDVQKWSHRQKANAPIWFVTRGSQPVEGPAALELAQSPIWGLARALSQEHPSLWGGLIDLDPAASKAAAAAALLAEIDNSDGEDQIAFRHDTRFVARLENSQSVPDRGGFQWRSDATYLVTGGLGEIGLELARWMTSQGARHLILLSRRPANDAAVRTIQQIEAGGAEVRIASVDVSDEAQLSCFLAKYRAENPLPIRGVFHAAGLVDIRPLSEIDAASLENILRPKVAGAWLLHRLLKDDPLDFFVLFSSFASLVSSPQLGSYAAANAFMDALAHYRRAENRPALAVNWGFWANVGMAARYLKDGRSLLRGVETFTPAQGFDVLGRLMRHDAPQIGVMRVDWKAWETINPAFTNSPVLSEIMRSASARTAEQQASDMSDVRESVLAADPAARPELIATFLRQHLARILRSPKTKVDVRRSLTTMGLDSMMAVELRNRIQLAFGVTVPIVTLLQGPSLLELGDMLSGSITASEDDWETLKI